MALVRLLILLGLLLTSMGQGAPIGVLTLRFLNVGQGDAVLITPSEGQSVLTESKL